MTRLKLKNRIRVPNRVALLAAIVLAASASIGPVRDSHHEAATDPAPREEAQQNPADATAADEAATSRQRFNFRLLLFRHG